MVPVTRHPLPGGPATAANPVSGRALIDTGASMTCVDRRAAERAGLAVVDSAPMHAATRSGEIVPVFAGRLVLQGFVNADTVGADGANSERQGPVALTGRDILAKCQLVYHGNDGLVSLAI